MSKKGENIRKRKDGRWEGRYKKGYKGNGSILYGSVYGKTYREVKEKMRTIATESYPPEHNTPMSEISFAALLQKWQDNNEVRLKGGTRNRYENLIHTHILPELGVLKLSEITTARINRFLSGKLLNGRLDGNIVLTYAIKGAQYVADPSLYDMDHGGNVPSDVNGLDIEPYRYIVGSHGNGAIANIERKLSEQVVNEINNGSLIFFSNAKTNVIGSDNEKVATFKNYIVYSTFVVQVNYEVKFPFRFLGADNPTIVKLSSRAEVAVNDAPEFIRNVDMVVDLLDGTKTAKNIQSIFDKINGFIKKFT